MKQQTLIWRQNNNYKCNSQRHKYTCTTNIRKKHFQNKMSTKKKATKPQNTNISVGKQHKTFFKQTMPTLNGKSKLQTLLLILQSRWFARHTKCTKGE